MANVRVNPKGQITLPREIRRKLKIKPGDQMITVLDGEQIVFKPFTKMLLDLRGSVKVKGEQDFEKIRHEALKKRANRDTSDKGRFNLC